MNLSNGLREAIANLDEILSREFIGRTVKSEEYFTEKFNGIPFRVFSASVVIKDYQVCPGNLAIGKYVTLELSGHELDSDDPDKKRVHSEIEIDLKDNKEK